MIRILPLLLTALLLQVSQPAGAAGLEPQQKTEIDELLQQTMTAARLPSVVALIDRSGETVYELAIGKADLTHQLPATVDTPYGIGSITKSVTALAVLQLAEQGKLSLDDTVQKFLPDYEGPGGVATVTQLLTHTSGIPNYTGEIPGIRESLERTAFSREQMVDHFEAEPLLFEPGSMFSYTNSGYYLLGLIIEAASGLDYYEYLESEVFEPLGMSHTSSGDYAEIIPGRAGGYALGEEGFINAPPWHYLVPFSAGSLISTAQDLVNYRRGVFHSGHISPELQRRLLESTRLTGGEPNIYALGGLVVSDFKGRRKISHAGDIWGYAANHAYYPDEDVTIILLTNRQFDSPAVSSIEAKIARIVFGIPPLEVRDLVLSAGELEAYTGNFDVRPYRIGIDTFGFIAQDGKLYIRFGGTEAEGPMIPLLAQGDGLFRAIFDDEWTFEFEAADESGRSARLVSHYRDGMMYAERRD